MIRPSGRLAAVVGLVLAVSACTTQVTGSPVPVPNPTTPQKAQTTTAQSLLGDLPTIDPCGYVEARDLKQFGEAVDGRPESLDFCLVTVTTGGAKLEVLFGTLERAASERDLKGELVEYEGLRIVEEPGESVRCARRLVFTDLVTLSVSVESYGEKTLPSTEMCRIANHATKVVADRVLAEEVEHRRFGPKSVGRLVACDAVRASLAKVPGLTSPKAYEYPAGHQCRWSNDGQASTPRARLTYAVGKPSEPDGKDSVREDVGGRPTVIYKSPASSVSFCVAETTHIPFENGLQELAVVSVSLPSGTPADQVCAAVREVAAEAWAKLPQ